MFGRENQGEKPRTEPDSLAWWRAASRCPGRREPVRLLFLPCRLQVSGFSLKSVAACFGATRCRASHANLSAMFCPVHLSLDLGMKSCGQTGFWMKSEGDQDKFLVIVIFYFPSVGVLS